MRPDQKPSIETRIKTLESQVRFLMFTGGLAFGATLGLFLANPSIDRDQSDCRRNPPLPVSQPVLLGPSGNAAWKRELRIDQESAELRIADAI